ncbi:EF-hand domain-containing protein [Rhodanobacter sp. MP7CTX1]|jgi:Ca2+-binding EF-hand superfamily protein|uniref:EF-hand domain-containing protein n=1 Tax=Rhodanobacter sp. MP7CTX1 TaxID=2723084 RepID=UPI001611E488|nr:EF-hand domain-containing protein [Rhodanobacter sp. MP7CTX1]MBB6188265.1 Ca2+-binding EF-hand superfamily protein [Rhodanobacter sp. MP7CTX1]
MRRLIIAAALCMPLATLAQSTPAEYLKLFDSNGDGKVSEAEYVAYMSQGFYRMDTNHDGVLESSELPGGRGKPITLKEFQDNLCRQFHQLDRHHHGYLNAQELTAPPQG